MERRDERDVEPSRDRRAKRKYEPPDILSQEVFETTALACMKVTGSACGASTKS